MNIWSRSLDVDGSVKNVSPSSTAKMLKSSAAGSIHEVHLTPSSDLSCDAISLPLIKSFSANKSYGFNGASPGNTQLSALLSLWLSNPCNSAVAILIFFAI